MSNRFDLKDSGARQEFDTGARRDLQKGKGRPDLISTIFKQRLSVVMEKGAEKYGDRNWELGIPLSRFASSAMRHLDQAFDGQTDEDHLGQAAFNIMGLMHTQEMIRRGYLPAALDDLPRPADADFDRRVRETYAALVQSSQPSIDARTPMKERIETIQVAEKIMDEEAENLTRAGLVEGLDGVWRGATTIDASVKNPGERQTPIYCQPTVFEPETGELDV